MQPDILETERLLLRQQQPADLDDYCAMEMDAEVRRYVGGYPRKREDAEKRFNPQPIANGLGMRATILKETGKYIGRCGIYPHFDETGNPITGEASIGLYIASAYWNKGYATEAGLALLHLAFEVLKLNRVVTLVEVGNDASVAVMGKLGFSIAKTETGQWRSFYTFIKERA